MLSHIRELIKYRELLYMITWRDIRVKYKQSTMGFLWAILMPSLIILTGTLVRVGVAQFSGMPLEMSQIYSVSVKAIPWAFFISSVKFTTNSLIGNSNLITKVYFPKEIFPIAAIMSQFFDFVIASCVLLIFLAFSGIGCSVQLLWITPLLLNLFLLVIGMGLFLSAANLFFRDVKYLVDVILSFAIFFTPVFYDSSIAGKWEPILLLNPVASILEGLNSSIVHHNSPKVIWYLYSSTLSVLGVYIGIKYFKNMEAKFAENI
jgi:lipopolysaccharide transport system permease protein